MKHLLKVRDYYVIASNPDRMIVEKSPFNSKSPARAGNLSEIADSHCLQTFDKAFDMAQATGAPLHL